MIISPKILKLLELLPTSVLRIFAVKFLSGIMDKYADISISGMENLDGEEGPFLFIGNHLSNSDGIVLWKVMKKWDPTFVAGVKLQKDALTYLGTIAVKNTPIVPNTADKAGISNIIKLIKSGENIVMFPEGTRSRVGAMIKARKGLNLIVKLSKARLVPIGIYGSEKLLPIGKDADMNRETLHKAKVYIKIGKPFEMVKRNAGEDRKEYEERATDEAMRKIAELLPEEYRGVYK
ncbi:1-acyl-sn-glycerol-3-phosphate acyltransferase [Clostridium pasteurianum DSM 525 = ATCC 6013]|uniref:1-acyl-sn-glycerol-3-phosphate acyltransferase n=1 Tax=Clostridium pasteurianum DSM 525 = ATCC 6013 TaxID=1262449 RepID=A0A0H3J0Q5_CLOPA|nr:lysophospholipid acyltransferase family protein [Clostridium pasteurianum]AJA47426.1 1-acyl-sn-glycerol-3-phosphate acyltransferase [Clostridium pasteurianum DSM 525 = ATCC 6013]AJA51414.1 1-acyl-sn-glycerol-3-phosphate acyltransferase [Clostridium pasteurianum DSM 525 = ATCC 6013]ELP58761.1 1-acyl-sn-glycerol-3-phosphate acyltransferase [Clostridium pasteurianum DSM 525 = ATCC 6013]KRU12579.1 phospholipid/glycerol acyltransferase [Clostridium pasteurianum DSM 525 = ATCC 6013]UZW15607.1 lys